MEHNPGIGWARAHMDACAKCQAWLTERVKQVAAEFGWPEEQARRVVESVMKALA